jgi:hypothetical protein
MRIPFITARREEREYERQAMARVEENMRAIEAAQAQEAEAEENEPARGIWDV